MYKMIVDKIWSERELIKEIGKDAYLKLEKYPSSFLQTLPEYSWLLKYVDTCVNLDKMEHAPSKEIFYSHLRWASDFFEDAKLYTGKTPSGYTHFDARGFSEVEELVNTEKAINGTFVFLAVKPKPWLYDKLNACYGARNWSFSAGYTDENYGTLLVARAHDIIASAWLSYVNWNLPVEKINPKLSVSA